MYSHRSSLYGRAIEFDRLCQPRLATLIRLQLRDGKSRDDLTDIRVLQTLMQIKTHRTVTKTSLNLNLKTRALRTLFMEHPIGDVYTKVTIHPEDYELFKDDIKDLPVLHLTFNCVNWRWDMAITIADTMFDGCETLEFSNLNVNFHEFTQMFKGTKFHPEHLILSGVRLGNTPTLAQAKMFKMILKDNMSQLKTLTWGETTFNL